MATAERFAAAALLGREAGKLFRSLLAVTAASLPSVVHAECIENTADDLVSNTGKVANTTATNQNNRVFLQVVAFTGNISRTFLTI